VCENIDIRYDLEGWFKASEGCRKVQGNVVIAFLNDLNENEWEGISFPLLTEITGYLMITGLSQIKSLSKLFPNLSVIRGDELYKGHALIIFENSGLENIGLNNLRAIEKGNVRIEKNDVLCFVDTVDWASILHSNKSETFFSDNKISVMCPSCRQGTANCWSLEQPQEIENNDENIVQESDVCKVLKVSADGSCVNVCPKDSFEVN
jgi:Receptor L domain